MVSWRTLLPLVGASLCAAQAPSNETAAETTAVLQGNYIVEFEGEQSTDALFKELFRDETLEIVPRLDLNFKLFQGASFAVKGVTNETDTLARIASSTRVKSVWPIRKVALPGDSTISTGQSNIAKALGPDSAQSKRVVGDIKYDIHVMTQIDRLHAEGITGKGVKIGIVDSGVDYMHPDLGGCYGPGCVVTYGHDFIGDGNAFDPQPDEDPRDTCMGHGTHVAGIIAGRPSHLGFLGAAPDAELGMYRALDCFGSSTTDILVASFNMAYEAGSDIISASVGIDGGWPDDPWSLSAQRIVDAGVLVVVAAGNDGELSIFRPSNPAAGRGVASVASIDARELPFLQLQGTYEIGGPEEKEERFGWISGSPALGNSTLPLFYIGSDTEFGNPCEALADDVPDLSEYLVLVEQREECNIDSQAASVVSKGGTHQLFFAPNDERPESSTFWAEGLVGAGKVTGSQGQAWAKELLAGGNITVTTIEPELSPQMVVWTPNKVSGGYTSFWSSWGPDWELNVNPTAAAPGGQILSTFPLALGSYSVEEGTSMACPLVAGAAALIGQVRGTFDPETIRAAITTTSSPLVFHDGQNLDPKRRLAPVPQGGPGILQAWDAAHIKTTVSTAAISFNDTDHIADVRFTVTNLNDEDATYALGNIPALTVYSFAEGSKRIPAFPPPIADGAEAELDFTADSITVKAGQSVEVVVGAIPPGAVDAERLPVYSGFLSLNGTNGDSLTIPYLGVASSMKDDTKFFYTEIATGVYLSASNQRWPIPSPPNTTFTIPDPLTTPINLNMYEYPQARVVVNVGSKEVRVDLIPQKGGCVRLPRTEWLGHQSIGQLEGFPYPLMTRASFRGTFAGLLANGAVVPAGPYRFLVSALKLFGDASKPEDWESVLMDPFILKYSEA